MSPGSPVDLELSVLLLADDDAEARRFAELLAGSELEADFRRAPSLEAGLRAARDGDPDIVVLDLDLTGRRGVDTVRRVAAEIGDRPLVVATGPDGLDTAIRTLGEGASEYLRRDGLTPALLARTLRVALERHRLDRAAERERALSRSILASLPDHIAVLEADGTIRAVNEAWRAFADEEGGDPRGYEGDNYLRVTERAVEQGSGDAREMLAGLQAVLDGERESFTMEYPCHGPDELRWFRVAVGPLRRAPPGGVVVSHTDITGRVERERELEARTAQLRERMKEQSCLYDVSELLHADLRDPAARLQAVVDRLPAGWQYPGITAARLTLGEQTWASDGFDETERRLATPVGDADDRPGRLEVVYLEERPERDHGPFLAEEVRLLEAVAEQVAVARDRWRARRQLEAERRRLEEVFAHSPAWVAVLRGPEHVYEQVNPAYRELVGDREFVGRPAREVVPELEGTGLLEMLDRVYETGEPVEVRERPLPLASRAGARQKHVSFVYQPRRENGEIVGVIAHGVDVTEQVEKRQQARAMEEKWASVIELAPVGIVISEPDTGRLHVVNEAFEEMFGTSAEEMIGRTSLELDQWDDPDRRDEVIELLRERGHVEGEEAWYRNARGERRRMRVSCRPLELAGEDRLIWTVEDVTEPLKRRRKLEETTERLRGLLDTAAGVIFRIRLSDLGMADVTPNIEEHTGYPVERWLEEPTFWKERMPDEDLEQILAAVDAAVEHRVEQTENEFRLRHADGSLRWYRAVIRYEDDDAGEPIAFVGTAVDVTERRQLEEQIRHQALHDPLTGLANRNLLEDRLEHALARSDRTGEPMALLMLDIASFKRINDNLGHTAGDQVLQTVARRLESVLRQSDTVARWGGDEFLLVLPELERPDAVANLQARLRETVEEPIEVRGEKIEIGVTVGGVVREETAGEGVVTTDRAEDLVRYADLALHRAKRRAHGGFYRFTPEESMDDIPDLRLEQDLRRGLRADEIEVFYQPVRRLRDGSVWGVEALARWRHPERGLVSPGEFIPLAERVGLIHQLGAAVFREGCRQAAVWIRDVPAAGDLRVAFNLSARELQEPGAADEIGAVLEEFGLPAGRVIVEVTETTIMRSPGEMEAIRELGVEAFIDDFGTGYSTYTYLRELDVQGLKIDMSFVQGLTGDTADAAIVESIATLGDRIGIEVIAEGIETEPQRARLEAIGCSLGQGYHLGRPVPPGEFEELLRG